MVYKIIVSGTAEKTYLSNIEFLLNNWSQKEVDKFILKTQEISDVLKYTPFAFQAWEQDPEIRKVPVVKQITIFYSVSGNRVEILLFWNCHQDPRKLLGLL